MTLPSVSAETLAAWKCGRHKGPDVDNLVLDMRSAKSAWNSKAIELLVSRVQQKALRERLSQPRAYPVVTDSALNKLATEKLDRMLKMHRLAQPKTVDGVSETPADVEERLNDKFDRLGASKRRTARRSYVSA